MEETEVILVMEVQIQILQYLLIQVLEDQEIYQELQVRELEEVEMEEILEVAEIHLDRQETVVV
jgi:hypothetical protein